MTFVVKCDIFGNITSMDKCDIKYHMTSVVIKV